MYYITTDVRSSLDDALTLTTPVKRGSGITVGQKKKTEKRVAEEAAADKERMQMPRLDLQGGGNREGTRGNSRAP